MAQFEITKSEWINTSNKIATIDEKVNHIYKAVIGNGRPGICSRMDILESSRNTMMWMFGIIGASFLGIISFLIKLLIVK